MSIQAHLRGKIDFSHSKISSVMLPISIGQPYHEGEQFFSTTQLVNKNFKETKIVLADTLQRYNVNGPDDEKKVAALVKEGDKWLERNKDGIEQINNVETKHWSDYLKHKDFEKKKTEIDQLYDTDSGFRKSVEDTVNHFLKRKYNLSLENITRENSPLAQSCISYIKEECAVFLLWLDIDKSSYLLYPNKVNPAIYNLMQRKTGKIATPLFTPLVIKFKKIKETYVNGLNNTTVNEVKRIHLDKDVLETFCRKYFDASISTYHNIDSPEDANNFLIKTLIGLSSFLKEVKVDGDQLKHLHFFY
jgi:tRNA-dependent cyclodipeptide synthase